MAALSYILIAAVALQRLAEMIYARHNTAALIARGAVEVGRAHYPLIVALHTAWLIAIVVALPSPPQFHWLAFAVFMLLEAGRIWVLMTLGPYWTTRVMTLPGAPLITGGPYRFVRHPNYLVVAGEIAVLPLVFGEWRIALLFTVLNAGVLAWRIRQEDAALVPRRHP